MNQVLEQRPARLLVWGRQTIDSLRTRREVRVGLLAMALLYTVLATLPLPPIAYGTGLEPSWTLGLNWARAQGMVVGRDIIFTYGPLGYLNFPEPASEAPTQALLYQAGLYLLWVAALVRLAVVIQPKPIAAWTVLLLGLSVTLDTSSECRLGLATVAVALLPLARSRWRYTELGIVAFLAGLGLMVKLNDGLQGVALFVAVAAITVARDWPLPRRRKWGLAAAICVLPLSVVVLYVGATGQLWSLGAYARHGMEIVSGYSEAMGLGGPFWQFILAGASLLLVLVGVPALAQNARALVPALAPAAIVAFMSFKHAMVRQDAHAAPFQLRLALAALFLLICARAARDRRLIIALQLFFVCMAYAITIKVLPKFEAKINARLELRRCVPAVRAHLNWPATWSELGAEIEENRAHLRLPDSFHNLIQNGSVDAIPWDIDRVKANGWKWRPRPVLQSYSAYTPALDRVNAEHLESGRAADFALVKLAAIDGRHPFLETPLAWRALLDSYDLATESPDLFLLRRRASPRFEPLVELGRSSAGWDEEVRVPESGGPLVMSPEIVKSLYGHVRTVLFRLSPVYLELKFRSGKTAEWRAVAGNLAGGFLIRPFPRELKEMRYFLLPGLQPDAADPVFSVRFRTPGFREFRPRIPIRWFRLPLKAAQAGPSPSQKAPLIPLWLPAAPPPRARNAELIRNPHWIQVIPVADDPQVTFHIGPRLGRYQTLVVRARFHQAERIDLYFGRQVDGRGLAGVVPVANRWLDIYVHTSHNPFWLSEHGAELRFDPAMSAGPGAETEIAGIWGSREAVPAGVTDMDYYPAPDSPSLASRTVPRR